LIHEEQLDSPILQVLIGKFIPSSPHLLGLAVLHPHQLTVYEFMPQGKPNYSLFLVWCILQHSYYNASVILEALCCAVLLYSVVL
jgi:hypothetical protein